MNEEFRICQLVDGTTLFVSNIKLIISCITILNRFPKYSGLKINLEKSTIIPIGSYTNKQINLPKELKQLCISHVNTWTDLFPLLECVLWKLIFSATHHITLETYLQTFQYKILNRLINCNFNLYKWKIKSEPYCDSCAILIDTIEHHLFLCPLFKKFWEEMEIWLNKQINMAVRIQFTICEVIFGIGINQLKTSFYNMDVKWRVYT